MAEILWLARADVESLLDLDELFVELRSALRLLSEGTASVPPRVGSVTPSGLVGAMPGYLPDAGVAVKLVSVFPDNHERGLPSHQAIIALFDPATGAPLAVMDGTHITAVRTGTTAAVAADILARRDTRALAILGAGVQGHSHLDAFSRVRPLDEIRIASRDAGRAEALAARHERAVAVPSFEEAVRGADIVCCCTDARDPIVRHEWLSPGAHVSSVGSGAEVDAATVAGSTVFVEWRGAVTNPPPAGATELQGCDPDEVTEIGEVLAGTRPGRRTGEEITLYKSTGHAVEDVAAAALVHGRAVTRGGGTRLAL